MPTEILLNGRSFGWSECSLADDVVAKMISLKKFLVSGFMFLVFRHSKGAIVGPQLETRNLKLET